MVNFVNIIFILLGAYLFFFSLIGVEGNLELLSERNYTCPEKFLSKQKLCDGINAFHDVCKAFIGAVILIGGFVYFTGTFEKELSIMQAIAFFSMLFDILISQILYHEQGLLELQIEIEEQWHKEKKISKEHDDEVRYFRQARNIGNIAKYNVIYLSILTLSSII